MVLPVGWTKGYDDIYYCDEFTHTDGRKQGTDPSQPDFTGVIALADVIPDMRALTSLNLASNHLHADGAKIIAEAIKVRQCEACGLFDTFIMSIWPLIELMLSAVIHRT